MKQIRKIEVSYEGMGTCIEATLSIGGKAVVVISAPGVHGNKITDEIVTLAKNYLIKKEQKRAEE